MSLVACRRVGALLLKGEWQEAVSTIMQPRGAAEATEVSEAGGCTATTVCGLCRSSL